MGSSRSLIGHERNSNNDRLTTLGSSYDFGVVKLFGSFSHYAPNVGTNVTGKVISASVPVSQSSAVKVAYGMSTPKNQSSDTKVAVGYWYDISKRTKVYTDIVRLHAGTTKVNTMVYDIGLRHAF